VLYQGGTDFSVTSKGTSTRGFVATGTYLNTASGVAGLTVAQLANSWLNFDNGFSGYPTTWWAEREGPDGSGGWELGRHVNYDVQSLIGPPSAVPEPSTIIAGALLLLPFGISSLRMLRKSRAA
jgi:hypothetical protein